MFQQQRMVRPVLSEYKAQLMAWSPLAQGQNGIFQNEVLKKIGDMHHKTTAQVNLRFLIQSGIAVIPKSVHKERLRENFSIFDFELTAKEMRAIQSLDLGRSQFIDHRACEVAKMFVSAGKVVS